MNHIINMMFLGILGGLIAAFWTRIIKPNMIFREISRRLTLINNRHLIEHATDSMLVKFAKCLFCVTPWLVLILELFYILDYNPWCLYCVIGTLGGLGSGNLVAELVCSLRNES